MILKKKLFLIVLISSNIFCYSQNNALDKNVETYILNIKNHHFSEAELNLKNFNSSSVTKKVLEWQYQFMKNGITKPFFIKDTLNLIPQVKAYAYINKADYLLNTSKDNDQLAFELYTKSLLLSKSINDTILMCESLKKILFYIYKNRKAEKALYEEYLKYYKENIYDVTEQVYYNFHQYNYEAIHSKTDRVYQLKNTLKQSTSISDHFIQGKLNQLIGIHYNYFLENKDSAFLYYIKAEDKFKMSRFQHYKNEIPGIYTNIGLLNQDFGDYIKALSYFKKADTMKIPTYRLLEKVKLNDLIAENFESRKMHDSANYYLKRKIKYLDSLNEYEKAIAISEINEKYKNAELRAENIEQKARNIKTEAEKKQKDSLLLISLSILTLVIISAYLIQKNTRKKQLLAEQAKDLEAQKVENLLQEQELASIDAMIEGQEKERKRIAEDLHDDLGALMATVKLHFDNIETAQNEDAVQKTSSLLDEAYEKIRTLAHAKNAGVIANQGLLVAVTNMSSKITDSNRLDIEVIAHGLEDRLENSLELSLFRMIQELIANIIKHAEATNATIQLTQHEKNLNIIVEDNGKGFEHSKIKEVGIGLETIKKRIAHLNGKLSIDSTLGKGTTILVDVPLT
ncbi:Signal transduction histidine-protein kinase/phosphatase DegS [Kordia antarctica]|uniref:Oxygen sensor histidine kinase NreB n=1 Tax=Kordia antarctica TaxID=1218801 RepID=A0A7L4ZHW8_9FLAO|nr:sensor histidine kinase [Kordia antarctica]QHI36195.1 Signal transduction histidine-protein kinase/phosphatase DegS [Kordia antarctica]